MKRRERKVFSFFPQIVAIPFEGRIMPDVFNAKNCHNRVSRWLVVTSTMLVLVVAFADPAISQDEKPTPSSERQNGLENSEATLKLTRKETVEDSVMSFDEMLSRAMRNNPDIRAGRARVIAAEAELDQTRLNVLHKIADYRIRWKERAEDVPMWARELEQALEKQRIEGGLINRRESLAMQVRGCRRNLTVARALLRETEAELPYLLGRQNVTQANAADVAAELNAAITRERLIPLTEQLVETIVAESHVGHAKLRDAHPWSRRLAELKVRTAATKAERVAAVQQHVEWLKNAVKMAEAKHRAQLSGQRDVLTAKVHLAEAELWLTEVADDSR